MTRSPTATIGEGRREESEAINSEVPRAATAAAIPAQAPSHLDLLFTLFVRRRNGSGLRAARTRAVPTLPNLAVRDWRSSVLASLGANMNVRRTSWWWPTD